MNELSRRHDANFYIIGFRAGIPSNAAGITFKDNGQEELNGYPFTGGVAPNWMSWTSGDPNTTICEESRKPHKPFGNNPGPIRIFEDGKVTVHTWPPKAIRNGADKPLIQVIMTTSPDTIAGVYRKFLGLTPRHTYRLSARLFALDMPKAQGGWSFSLHAVATGQDKSDLTAQQMAGLAALPDGETGLEAGLIALYAPGVSPVSAQQPTTRPKRKTARKAADEPAADLVAGDIRLPEGADTIIVWVRHEAAHSTGVGLDWVRLEDVTKP